VADFVVEADVWTDAETLERQRIVLPLGWSPEAGTQTHPEVERVFILLEAARARREAVERGDQGDLDGAARTLREAARSLEARKVDDLTVREEIQDLARTAEEMEAAAEFRSMDRKYLSHKERAYSRSSRSSGDRVRRE
jgi:hypothetical protein